MRGMVSTAAADPKRPKAERSALERFTTWLRRRMARTRADCLAAAALPQAIWKEPSPMASSFWNNSDRRKQ